MASSSGNSSVSTKFLQSSGSEEDLQHLDDLIAEVDRLRKENSEIFTRVNIIAQKYVEVEKENCILRAQMGELSQSLESLNGIINLINISSGVYQTDCYLTTADYFMNHLNMPYLNQPIMASADMFQW
ncbi:hypothetical protein SESBI_23877 [Sesbania bispinosa]|nr:hypothetical protein SESBI_23877 [Sesbania bispinosa]